MTVDEKLDKVLANQLYITQLLESILEAIPSGKKPDLQKIMAPLMQHPMIKNVPGVADMINEMAGAVGGNNDE